MITDPLGTALKQITETKDLLEALITSSESFDYPQARVALKKLNRKVRELGKLQTKFQRTHDSNQPNIFVLDFKAGTRLDARNS
jgi:hypothetical protein